MKYLYTLLSILTGFIGPIIYALIEHELLVTKIINQPTSLLYIFGFILLLVAFHNMDLYFDKGIGRNFYRMAFVYRKTKLIFWLGAVYGLVSIIGSYSASVNDLLLIVIVGQIAGSCFGYLATSEYVKEEQSK